MNVQRVSSLFLVTVAAISLSACMSAVPKKFEGKLATADEPHANFEMLRTEMITLELYPAEFLFLDGEEIPPRNFREWRLTPGEHSVVIRPLRAEIQRWAPTGAGARLDLLPVFSHGKEVTFTVEAGKRYMFAAQVKDLEWSEWKPVIFVVNE